MLGSFPSLIRGDVKDQNLKDNSVGSIRSTPDFGLESTVQRGTSTTFLLFYATARCFWHCETPLWILIIYLLTEKISHFIRCANSFSAGEVVDCGVMGLV